MNRHTYFGLLGPAVVSPLVLQALQSCCWVCSSTAGHITMSACHNCCLIT